jgi:hypothetical protein
MLPITSRRLQICEREPRVCVSPLLASTYMRFRRIVQRISTPAPLAPLDGPAAAAAAAAAAGHAAPYGRQVPLRLLPRGKASRSLLAGRMPPEGMEWRMNETIEWSREESKNAVNQVSPQGAPALPPEGIYDAPGSLSTSPWFLEHVPLVPGARPPGRLDSHSPGPRKRPLPARQVLRADVGSRLAAARPVTRPAAAYKGEVDASECLRFSAPAMAGRGGVVVAGAARPLRGRGPEVEGRAAGQRRLSEARRCAPLLSGLTAQERGLCRRCAFTVVYIEGSKYILSLVCRRGMSPTEGCLWPRQSCLRILDRDGQGLAHGQ